MSVHTIRSTQDILGFEITDIENVEKALTLIKTRRISNIESILGIMKYILRSLKEHHILWDNTTKEDFKKVMKQRLNKTAKRGEHREDMEILDKLFSEYDVRENARLYRVRTLDIIPASSGSGDLRSTMSGIDGKGYRI